MLFFFNNLEIIFANLILQKNQKQLFIFAKNQK